MDQSKHELKRFTEYKPEEKISVVRAMKGRLSNCPFFQCMVCRQKRATDGDTRVKLFQPRREHLDSFRGLRVYVVCGQCLGALTPDQLYTAVADGFKLVEERHVVGVKNVPDRIRRIMGS